MKKISLIIGLILAVFFSVSAQLSFGPKVGLNLAKVAGDNTDEAEILLGAQIGAIVNIGIAGPISIQPGVMFSMKGAKSEFDDSGVTMTRKMKLNYIEIPLNIVAGFGPDKVNFQVIAGPYVGIGMSGKIKTKVSGTGGILTGDEDIDIDFMSDIPADYDFDNDPVPVNGLDYGLNFGLGFRLGKLQTQVLYGLGLANMNPKFDGEKPDDKMTNSNIQISFALLFGNK